MKSDSPMARDTSDWRLLARIMLSIGIPHCIEMPNKVSPDMTTKADGHRSPAKAVGVLVGVGVAVGWGVLEAVGVNVKAGVVGRGERAGDGLIMNPHAVWVNATQARASIWKTIRFFIWLHPFPGWYRPVDRQLCHRAVTRRPQNHPGEWTSDVRRSNGPRGNEIAAGSLRAESPLFRSSALRVD
jgi:hypothetical protein